MATVSVAGMEDNMKKVNLDGISRVRFCDYTEYNSEKCNNGGCYGFWKDYNRTEAGLFEVSYGTTADFEYCPCCGSFNNHNASEDNDIFESGYTCGEFGTVTESELLELINGFDETEDEFIEYK